MTGTIEQDKRPRGTGSIFMRGSTLYIRYYSHGQRIVESTHGNDREKAERKLHRALRLIETGEYLAPKQRRVKMGELFNALIADYRMRHKASLNSLEAKWTIRLDSFFGDYQASQVTTDLLTQYILKCQKDGLTNGTVNRDMSALKRAFTLGYKCTPRKVQQIPVFPARLPEANPRTGFVEQAAFDSLYSSTQEPWMRALIVTAYAHGFRYGELLAMKVNQVDLRNRTIRLWRGTTKSKEPRLIAMTSDVHAHLLGMCTDKSNDDYVFTRNKKRIKDSRDAWQNMCVAAGLGKFVCRNPECKQQSVTKAGEWKCEKCGKQWNKHSVLYVGLIFHDLRRSAIRNMVRRGISEKQAMLISGHKTRSVFDRYNITSERDLAIAAQKIEAGAKAERSKMQSEDFGAQFGIQSPTYSA